MKSFFKSVGAIITGFVVASIVMLVFEYANSQIYQFPPGFNQYDAAAVRAFASMREPGIYYMVIIGWICGSIAGAWVTTRLCRERAYRSSMILSLLLVLAGIANSMMIHHPVWFDLIMLPQFILTAYVGHRLASSTKTK